MLLLAVALAALGVTFPAGVAGAGPAFTFTGSGWGHGVGMSQWGARGLAAQGWSHTQILTHYYSGTQVQGWPVSNDLRVLLGTAGTFTLTSGGTASVARQGEQPFANVGPGGTFTLSRSGNGVAVGGATSGWAPSIVVFPGGPLRVSPPGYQYRWGVLVVSPDAGGGLRAVLVNLSMQQYLYGLGEMPSSWPDAALRSQAVAARTFAERQTSRANRWASDFDLYGGLPHQSYIGWDKEGGAMGDRWRAAVDSTANQVVTYGGQLIDAVYSASSGGHTENSEVVWVSPLPYLRGVPDLADGTGGNPHASWSRTYSGEALGAWFGLGTVTSVQILGPVGVSGRVDKATIRLVGTGGTKDVRGDTFRSTVNKNVAGSQQLMSSKFTVGGAPAPSAPASTPLEGVVDVARADGRTIVIGGWARGPGGAPVVRVVSRMGGVTAVRETRPGAGDRWAVAWNGAPGTRNVCVTAIGGGAVRDLGCRDVVVK